MPAVYTSFASFSFCSKHGEDKILLSGSLAGCWAGGCWTLQDHAWAAIVFLPFLRPSSSQIPGELTASSLPNNVYAPAPKAFKILTRQLLFKLLEGTYLPHQRHLPQHPQTRDNARFLRLPPAENPLFPRRISVKHRSLLSACSFCADPQQTWIAHINFKHKRLCFLGNSPRKSLMHACKKTQTPAHTHGHTDTHTHGHTQTRRLHLLPIPPLDDNEVPDKAGEVALAARAPPLQTVASPNGQRINTHCRAGIARPVSYRLGKKEEKGQLGKNIAREWNAIANAIASVLVQAF